MVAMDKVAILSHISQLLDTTVHVPDKMQVFVVRSDGYVGCASCLAPTGLQATAEQERHFISLLESLYSILRLYKYDALEAEAVHEAHERVDKERKAYLERLRCLDRDYPVVVRGRAHEVA